MEMMEMMGGNMMGMGGMMMWPMMLAVFLFGVLIILGIVLLIRSVWNKTNGGGSTAERILQERFARGEIDSEEYWERRNVLERQ